MTKRRPYQCEEDYLLMQDLIRLNFTVPQAQLYPCATDLDYWRYIYDESPDGVHDAQLWQAEDGRLLGFVWMNEDATDLVCHYAHTELLDEMLAWSEEERLKTAVSQTQEDIVNCITVFDCDPEGELFAGKRGYKQTETFSYYGKRSLLDDVQPVCLPDGYMIRSIDTDDEIRQRAEMNELAGNEITYEKYKAFMQKSANYRRELDLIALSPDGNIAGFCTVWHDPIGQIGAFEPYGVHPDHLRKGLGRSLLLEGMNRLRALGATAVFTSHGGLDSDALDPALSLNAAVGFEKVGRNYVWIKALGAHSTK
jgi:ribosomal protein S18 acetylase RimI-like enzyme